LLLEIAEVGSQPTVLEIKLGKKGSKDEVMQVVNPIAIGNRDVFLEGSEIYILRGFAESEVRFFKTVLTNVPNVSDTAIRLSYMFKSFLPATAKILDCMERLRDWRPGHRPQERAEFVGDRVLELIVTDVIVPMFPEAGSGKLTRVVQKIVCNIQLAEVALKTGLK